MCNAMETCCTCNMYMLHGQTLKSATSDYDQRHVIVFQPISVAARSWSYDKSLLLTDVLITTFNMLINFISEIHCQFC